MCVYIFYNSMVRIIRRKQWAKTIANKRWGIFFHYIYTIHHHHRRRTFHDCLEKKNTR